MTIESRAALTARVHAVRKHVEAMVAELPLGMKARLMEKGLGIDPILSLLRDLLPVLGETSQGWQTLKAVLALAKEANVYAPEIIIEEDGELGMDWYVGKGYTMTVIVGDAGRISWAALLGEWKARGNCQLQPDAALRDAFQRLAGVPDPPASLRAPTGDQ